MIIIKLCCYCVAIIRIRIIRYCIVTQYCIYRLAFGYPYYIYNAAKKNNKIKPNQTKKITQP